MYVILGVGTVVKLGLYAYCAAANTRAQSDILAALAEDHLNDVWSNSAAILALCVASYTTVWWADAVGAIVISVVIIARWLCVIWEQIKKIAGHTGLLCSSFLSGFL